jgi:hypothetical protein
VYNYLLGNPEANCLVVKRGGGLGDSLMLEFSIGFLRQQFPEAKVTVAYGTEKEAAYFSGSLADYLDPRDFDKVVDVSSCSVAYERPGSLIKNRIDIYKNRLSCPGILYPQLKQKETACPSEFITVHCTSEDPNRSWPLSNVVNLSKVFSDERFKVLDTGYSLEEAAYLINKSKLFIGVDSLFMHMAGILGRRAIVLFGPSVPSSRLAYYPTHTPLYDPSCRHCWHQECLLKRSCMNRIPLDTVSAQLEKILAEI